MMWLLQKIWQATHYCSCTTHELMDQLFLCLSCSFYLPQQPRKGSSDHRHWTRTNRKRSLLRYNSGDNPKGSTWARICSLSLLFCFVCCFFSHVRSRALSKTVLYDWGENKLGIFIYVSLMLYHISIVNFVTRFFKEGRSFYNSHVRRTRKVLLGNVQMLQGQKTGCGKYTPPILSHVRWEYRFGF